MSESGAEVSYELGNLAREVEECIEALRGTDLMVYIDENDDARQLVNFTAPRLARAVLDLQRQLRIEKASQATRGNFS